MFSFEDHEEQHNSILGALDHHAWYAVRGHFEDPRWFEGAVAGIVFLLGDSPVLYTAASGEEVDGKWLLRSETLTESSLIVCTVETVGRGQQADVTTYAVGLASVTKVEVDSRYTGHSRDKAYPTIDRATLHFRDHPPVELAVGAVTADRREQAWALIQRISSRLV